jgi:branched-chain amino acid transport system substrate-binding protein
MNKKGLLVLAGILLFGAGMAFAFLLGDRPERGQETAPAAAGPDRTTIARPAPAPQAEEEPERALKVGVIGPETGAQAAFGLRILDGVLMAAGRLNDRGGIGGNGIEVVHYDNKGDPDLTIAAANELIRQNVIAIFSAPTGWSTFAPTHLANGSRTIFISVGTRRRIGRSGAYIFRYALPDEIATDDLVRFASEDLGYTDYALVTSSAYDHSLTLSALFKQAVLRHGGTIGVEADTYDTFSGATNLAGVVEALERAPEPPQAIIFTGEAGEGARLARAARAAGVTVPFIGGEDLFTGTYLNEGAAAVRGSLLYATFSPDDDSPRLAEFMETFAREKGGVPDRFTALAYDALTLVAEAIEKAGSLKSSAVRKALLNGRLFEGATGAIRWTPDGGPVKHAFIYRVEVDGAAEKFVLVQAAGGGAP